MIVFVPVSIKHTGKIFILFARGHTQGQIAVVQLNHGNLTRKNTISNCFIIFITILSQVHI